MVVSDPMSMPMVVSDPMSMPMVVSDPMLSSGITMTTSWICTSATIDGSALAPTSLSATGLVIVMYAAPLPAIIGELRAHAPSITGAAAAASVVGVAVVAAVSSSSPQATPKRPRAPTATSAPVVRRTVRIRVGVFCCSMPIMSSSLPGEFPERAGTTCPLSCDIGPTTLRGPAVRCDTPSLRLRP